MSKQWALGAEGGNHRDWMWQKLLCRLVAVEELEGSCWRDAPSVTQWRGGNQVRLNDSEQAKALVILDKSMSVLECDPKVPDFEGPRVTSHPFTLQSDSPRDFHKDLWQSWSEGLAIHFSRLKHYLSLQLNLQECKTKAQNQQRDLGVFSLKFSYHTVADILHLWRKKEKKTQPKHKTTAKQATNPNFLYYLQCYLSFYRSYQQVSIFTDTLEQHLKFHKSFYSALLPLEQWSVLINMLPALFVLVLKLCTWGWLRHYCVSTPCWFSSPLSTASSDSFIFVLKIVHKPGSHGFENSQEIWLIH